MNALLIHLTVGMVLGALLSAPAQSINTLPGSGANNTGNEGLDLGLGPRRKGFWPAPANSGWNPSDVAVSGSYVYVADEQLGLVIIDATDAAKPRLMGRAGTGARGMAIAGNHAFVAGEGGLEVFDVSNPSNPARVGQYTIHGQGTAVAAGGNRAYLTTLGYSGLGGVIGSGLRIIDVSDPATPRDLGGYSRQDAWSAWGTWDVAVSGGFAYLATTYPQLQVIDVRNPASPASVAVHQLPLDNASYDLAIAGNELYLRLGARLAVMDILDPASPREIGSLTTGAAGEGSGFDHAGLAVAGSHLWVIGRAGLQAIDVRDPTHLAHAGCYASDGPATAMAVAGDQAYLTTMIGLEIIDLTTYGFHATSIKHLADGSMRIAVNNTCPDQDGQPYLFNLEASTNLVDWETLETQIGWEIKLTFTDTNAPSYRHRFYRVSRW